MRTVFVIFLKKFEMRQNDASPKPSVKLNRGARYFIVLHMHVCCPLATFLSNNVLPKARNRGIDRVKVNVIASRYQFGDFLIRT